MKTVVLGLIIPFIGTAAGAMLYVVVEELIPEMSAGAHSNTGVVSFCSRLQPDDGAGRGARMIL